MQNKKLKYEVNTIGRVIEVIDTFYIPDGELHETVPSRLTLINWDLINKEKHNIKGKIIKYSNKLTTLFLEPIWDGNVCTDYKITNKIT